MQQNIEEAPKRLYSFMRITLLQTDIIWSSPGDNIQQAAQLMDSSRGSELYVLPEMWSTGFATQPEGIAETDGQSLAWMISEAQNRHAAICGSIAEGEHQPDGSIVYHNRHYFVGADGKVSYYDKRHLFGYAGEDAHYRRGETRTVVSCGGWRWLLLVCYDLRFPVWSRYDGDYDGIIIVANWPSSRQPVWDTLIRARAIENQCCVVAVNRVGQDEKCTYQGGSMVVDAKGRVIARCPDNEVAAVTADLDIEELRAFRAKFPVLNDRDHISEFID